jgi:DNA-binding MarR family transcriptional regulator
VDHVEKQTSAFAASCTCLRLRKAARRVSQIYDQHLGPYGVTVTQYGLLGHVKAFDGIGVGALAEKLVMDPTTLTRNLRPLERRGLLVMAPAPNDRRNRNLHLTDAGREAHAAAYPGWKAAQRQVAEVLGDRDGPALAVAIDHMLEKLT